MKIKARREYFLYEKSKQVYELELNIDPEIYRQIITGLHPTYKTITEWIEEQDDENDYDWSCDGACIYDETYKLEYDYGDLQEFDQLNDIVEADDLKVLAFTTGDKKLYKTLQGI